MSIKKVYQESKGLLLFLILMIFFRSSLADWNTVPTGSMNPTIVEGDRIWINKVAYDFKLPFTDISLQKLGEPRRGDIVIFNSQSLDKRLVKRVIGLPGETVSMVNNIVHINGKPLSYKRLSSMGDESVLQEAYGGMNHLIRIDMRTDDTRDSFSPVIVPENHYLVLGDNRNNSADSRAIGFIPRSDIIGKSSMIVMSFNYDNYYIPRKDRFLIELQQ